MPSVNDIHGFDEIFDSQLAKLDRIDIPEPDREAVLDFMIYRSQQVETSTACNNFSCLIQCVLHSEPPLVDSDIDDVRRLLFYFKNEEGKADGTLRNYRKALRAFYKWRGETWWDDIEVGSSHESEIVRADLLSSEEVQDLFDACFNLRDKAMLALFADTGLRIGALGTLRIQDIDFVGRGGRIRINQDAVGTKGAKGPFPMTWSRGFVVSWMNQHPRPDDPEAPLFHKLEDRGTEGDALKASYIRQRFYRIARRAGIERTRVNPHNFRHRAITRWRQQHNDSKVEARAGWVKGSRQKGRYDHAEREQLCDQTLAEMGLVDEDELEMPSLENCPQCGMGLPDGDPSFCAGCGMPLTDEALDALDAMKDRTYDSTAQDPAYAEEYREFAELLDEHPEIADARDG